MSSDIESAIGRMNEEAERRRRERTTASETSVRERLANGGTPGRPPDFGELVTSVVPRVAGTGASHPVEASDAVISQGRGGSRVQLALPKRQLEAAGYLTVDTPKGLLTEQYRSIKRPLLRNVMNPDRVAFNANVIMVTSSLPGEGKTFNAINLAMSLALERDRTVLLIDADVVKASASTRLGVPENAPGLIELLEDGGRDAGDAILQTDVPDLRVLPAGKRSVRANELLSSAAMSALMGELSTRYADRLIVLDCPPILAANEAVAVSEHVGQVVFVVAEGATRQRDADAALARFDADRYVGVLMNKRRGAVGSAYKYGYG